MLSDELQSQVLPALRQGRYSLLLGAGASMASRSKDGSPLPSGGQLKDELAEKYGLPSKYSLARIASSIDDADGLRDYLMGRFSNCQPSNGALCIPKFVWRSIYTLNIDDVIPASYRMTTALQQIKELTYADAYYEPSDIEELKTVFLHGSVTMPAKGFVFSLQEYGNAAARDSIWLKILADEVTYSPFIVVGASLEESDIEYYLARRSSIPPDGGSAAPSLFVSRTIDPVTTATCRRFGLVPIEADAEAFLLALDRITGQRPSALELVLPRDRKSIFVSNPTERAQRIFFRQWVVVDPEELPKQLSENNSISLLRGTEPTWSQLVARQDIQRATVGKILQRILVWAQASTKPRRVDVLVASAGAGKSTALMRLCLDLVESGIRVFYFSGTERIADAETVEIIQKLAGPAAFIVDSVAEHAAQITAIIHRLDELRIGNVFVVGAERLQRMKHVANAFVNIPYESTDLARLSSAEAHALVLKLRSEGLLGRKAGRLDSDLSQGLQAKDLFSRYLRSPDLHRTPSV